MRSHAFHSGGIFRRYSSFIWVSVCIFFQGVCYQLECMQIHLVFLFKPFSLVFRCDSLQLPVLTTFVCVFFSRICAAEMDAFALHFCSCFLSELAKIYKHFTETFQAGSNSKEKQQKQHHHLFKFKRDIATDTK